ncbi:hypothetical protein PBC5_007 [Bacillus phage PBC5]|nr:hypothetical protein PBC5_007 [Bacillus phage PBC5]
MAMCRDKATMYQEVKKISATILWLKHDLSLNKARLSEVTVDLVHTEIARLEKSLDEHLKYCEPRFTKEDQEYIKAGVMHENVY